MTLPPRAACAPEPYDDAKSRRTWLAGPLASLLLDWKATGGSVEPVVDDILRLVKLGAAPAASPEPSAIDKAWVEAADATWEQAEAFYAPLREAANRLASALFRLNGNACDDDVTNALESWRKVNAEQFPRPTVNAEQFGAASPPTGAPPLTVERLAKAEQALDNLAGALNAFVRKPGKQYRYSRCSACDLTWWDDNERHNLNCPLLVWRDSLDVLRRLLPRLAAGAAP